VDCPLDLPSQTAPDLAIAIAPVLVKGRKLGFLSQQLVSWSLTSLFILSQQHRVAGHIISHILVQLPLYHR